MLEDDDSGEPRRRKPPVTTGSGRSSSGTGGNSEFRLSAARVQAMKEAGAWDDPVKRKRMIDAYRRHDAAAANRSR